MKNDERQADATVIAITPAMIDAGVIALDDNQDCSSRGLAKLVFLAMIKENPKSWKILD